MEQEKPLVARHIQPALTDGLRHFRVVLLHGPRQSGKTTIARNLAQELGGTYWTLEDKATRSALRDDPLNCLLRTGPVFIDEIQLGGDDLVQHIKCGQRSLPEPLGFDALYGVGQIGGTDPSIGSLVSESYRN